jgi:hypothetical protein
MLESTNSERIRRLNDAFVTAWYLVARLCSPLASPSSIRLDSANQCSCINCCRAD